MISLNYWFLAYTFSSNYLNSICSKGMLKTVKLTDIFQYLVQYV